MASAGKAAVIREKSGPFHIEDVEVGEPRADEVLVRIVASGICHTDIIVRDQVLPPGPPAILGHEGAGVVEAVGSGVGLLAPGDHVVLAPMSCSMCRNCLIGHPMNCDSFTPLNFGGCRADGSTAYHDSHGGKLNAHFFGQSSFSSHVVVSARSAVKVSDQAPLELLGPLGCGMQTGAGAVLHALAPPAGASIVVFGAGAVGLAAVMGAVIAGCDPIIAVDLNASRLDMAVELGATHAVQAAEDAVEQIQAVTGGGADFALDAVGLPTTLRQAFTALNVGGTAGLVGANALGQEVSLDLMHLLFGRTVKGIIEGDTVPSVFIPRLVELHLRGRFPFDKIVKRYPFTEINTAVADTEAGRAIKSVLIY
ncbi:NAD(P)-dependent alcohol dehydrogenase [Mycobacterium helveticum]|uniref:NAD(P)-dependent alcohol dehydrogenase n=1 Tax=Mycobacterium helveticum TaxID=2592811 RepID=A0A557XR83_9MYCO|nr:NAD(P)-dependent alcohol dehydrogenase [Mycobacterium helveticum]TVS85092.1 NAD(P)-dependent alcohol dehydrogenase [Mycobacterium helveticum]TVS88437.1 NAD(P)-dependent alcohol dehydrogenase [Mycobacterium helveticum]